MTAPASRLRAAIATCWLVDTQGLVLRAKVQGGADVFVAKVAAREQPVYFVKDAL